MSRIGPLLVIVAMTAACTPGDAEEIATSTTDTRPATSLAPQTSTSTTTKPSPPTTTTTTTTAPAALPDNECEVNVVSSVDGYTQGCTVFGIPILAGDAVDPAAVAALADRMYFMLLTRPDLQASILERTSGGRVIPKDTPITSLPEFGDLNDQYPGTDWDRRGRGFAGTDLVPYFAGAEEDLLCLEGDQHAGEDDFIRTFALTIRRFGLDPMDSGTSAAIDQAYARAIAQGLWTNTLAEINSDEYWQEGTQSYFDANLEDTADERKPNSTHNAVDTREELEGYDPALWTIATSVYGDGEWRPGC